MARDFELTSITQALDLWDRPEDPQEHDDLSHGKEAAASRGPRSPRDRQAGR